MICAIIPTLSTLVFLRKEDGSRSVEQSREQSGGAEELKFI